MRSRTWYLSRPHHWSRQSPDSPARHGPLPAPPKSVAVHAGGVKVTLCVLLWARPGAEDGLIAYEDTVLELVPGHGGRVLQRARGSGADGQPLEIQLLEFPAAAALDAYMTDDRRTSLAAERDRVISRTDVIQVQLVS